MLRRSITIFDVVSKVFFSVTVKKENKLMAGVLNYVPKISILTNFIVLISGPRSANFIGLL